MNNSEETSSDVKVKKLAFKEVRNEIFQLTFYPGDNIYVVSSRKSDSNVGLFKEIATFKDRQKAKQFFDNLR